MRKKSVVKLKTTEMKKNRLTRGDVKYPILPIVTEGKLRSLDRLPITYQ